MLGNFPTAHSSTLLPHLSSAAQTASTLWVTSNYSVMAVSCIEQVHVLLTPTARLCIALHATLSPDHAGEMSFGKKGDPKC